MGKSIQVNGIYKRYNYGTQNVKESFFSTFVDPLLPDLFRKDVIEKKLGKNDFWALNDVSFEVNKGEILGIIGANGAGKSTILKILSRITPPTFGSIEIRGSISSLLEVGTGFNPELTGRENIYLNGAILGMKRQYINSKFKEIVEFSGIEKFIDTPVKRYSSGMYTRLAFAVASHLRSEILIVDEVLAVGDAEFQKKSLGKMDEITNKEGRTIIFVSHNMGAIAQLCNKAIVMIDGQTAFKGDTNKAISLYLNKHKSHGSVFRQEISKLKKRNQFTLIYNANSANKVKNEFGYDDEVTIVFEAFLPNWDDTLEVGIFPCDALGRRIFMVEVPLKKYYSGNPHIKLSVTIPSKILTPGEYSWEIFIHNPIISLHDHQKGICDFSINEAASPFLKYSDHDCGVVAPPTYSITKLT